MCVCVCVLSESCRLASADGDAMRSHYMYFVQSMSHSIEMCGLGKDGKDWASQ